MTVVMPLRIDLLSEENRKLTELATGAVKTNEELARTKLQLAEAKAALSKATSKSPFADQSVYPIGFDNVVIGTPVAEVVRRIPAGKWDEENSYYSTPTDRNANVRSATYYFDGKGDGRRVSFILFHLNLEGAATLFHSHFLAAFGEPDAKRRQDVLWKTTRREWIAIEGPGAYVVYEANYSLARSKFQLASK